MKAEQVVSAGGVLVADVGGRPHIVVLHHRRDEWRLPKGKMLPGETPRQAAVREVVEEAGIAADPCELLGQTEYEYWDPQTNRKVRKRVLFYLMPLPGEQTITPEGPTFDEARWVPLAESQSLLTFEGERRIVRQAAARMACRSE